MLTSDQIRAGRALVRLSQVELAELSGVSLETIKRLETTEGELKTRLETVTRIKAALERAGIDFIPENGGGAGVRLVRGRTGK